MPKGVYKHNTKGENNPFYGKHHTEATKEINKKAHLGLHTNKGVPKSETHKEKIRQTLKKRGQWKNEKNPTWNGGISFNNPYPVDWTKDLKRAIRKRDKYTCQLCGKEPAIVCHHIDYNKKNCNSDNLITLCSSCHNKTNSHREYWKNYFQNRINNTNL